MGMVMLVKLPQSPNASSQMEVTELGMVTLVSPLQPASIPSLMESRKLGIVTLIRLVQSQNAQSPIVVTELGMVMLVSPLQPENA